MFIAVGTPSRRGDGHADLVLRLQGRARDRRGAQRLTVVVTKSTVPVGTGDEVERIIREGRPDADFAVVSNPEFLREGAAIHDFKHPDRIVIGAEDERAREVMKRDLPAALPQPGADPVHVAADRRADQICRQRLPRHQDHLHQRDRRPVRAVGADVQDVARGIGLDNRIGAEVPARRPGLWRLLLSQGHAGPAQDGRGPDVAAAHRRDGGRRSTTRASARWPQGRSPRSAAVAARPSPCSA